MRYFTIGLVSDGEFENAGRIMRTAVERHLKEYFKSINYGSGVQEMGIGIVMFEGPKRRRRRPHYVRERRTNVIGRSSENTLEFNVYPSLDSVRSATSAAELVESLRATLVLEGNAVRALNIPDFDTSKFFEDLDVQLAVVARSVSTAGLIAEPRAIPEAPPIAATVPETNIYKFPSSALAFVEQELPLARLAGERRDRAALGQFLERWNKFIAPWEGVMRSERRIFDTFEDCALLIPDLAREIMIECDRPLTDTEREDLHAKFQRRLAACRACVERIARNR